MYKTEHKCLSFKTERLEGIQKALSNLEAQMKEDWMIRIDFKEMTFENVLKIGKSLIRR